MSKPHLLEGHSWINEGPQITVQSSEVKQPLATAFSIPVRPVRKRSLPKVRSYFFTEMFGGSDEPAPSSVEPNDVKRSSARKSSARNTESKPAKKSTRFQLPSDVVKLDDRLFYLLQPPLENLFAGNTVEFPFKPFPFQFAGIAFLFPRHNAILADEMGLGKTMQTISTIRLLLRAGQLKSVLLICPKPLVTNWQKEFSLWAPEVPVSVVQGNQAQRKWHWTVDKTPVKIANYELMHRDVPIIEEAGIEYDLVALDEAQRIKNQSNTTSQAIKKLQRSRSWALTGTPIENGIEDLIGICSFASPGSLSGDMNPRTVRREVKDLILRRTKEMVMTDMPPKLVRDAELSLTPEQWASYQQAEEAGVIRLNNLGHEITIKHVFELVLRLKQICNFDPATGASSKTEAMLADLEEVAASGQKAIVFSQWVDAIEEIAKRSARFNPLQYHGRIPSSKRDGILREFKENPDRTVLLMSYGAGSVGLNLQFCRYVFLFDRWWNPAIEDQAINRAHRIGAAGSVTVTRMIMSGTIEQRIHDILEEKRELFREILSDNSQPKKRGLTRDEVFGLFQLKTPEGTIKPSAA